MEEKENDYGELAQKIIDSNNAALEDRDPKPDDDILAIFSTKDEDLQKMGCRMMLEASITCFSKASIGTSSCMTNLKLRLPIPVIMLT